MLVHATLKNISSNAPEIPVQFNPTEYGIDRGANYAELQVPGLATPLLQFVRGEASTLTLELFLDCTDARASLSSGSAQTDSDQAPPPTAGSATANVTKSGTETRLDQIRELVKIQKELHAPPVCNFTWSNVSFDGVVTSLKEKYTLFDESGHVLRARVTLALKRYQSVEAQLAANPLRSPDHTRVRVVRTGETLTQIANEVYGDPRMWKLIATTNDIDRPRFLVPGTALFVPAI